ncbi:MAG: ribonuclease HI family protein [Leptospiraceae bacterium]|nr:ribonuclease HI family protein [Leptospiraceae bacterium]MDW7975557.1 ribonuclease HI family protein [Leptospiraceae bacterium]
MNKKTIKIFCDGASKGNPGPAGIGGLILIDDQVIKEISQYVGNQTNNVAEYLALSTCLKEIVEILKEEKQSYHLEIYMDSELIVKQIQGEYQVKNQNLIPIYNDIISSLGKFSSFHVHHIPREENKRADKLANQAIKQFLKKKPIMKHKMIVLIFFFASFWGMWGIHSKPLLDSAIDAFLQGNINKAKKTLKQIQEDEVSAKKDFLKLNFLIFFLEKDFLTSRFYFDRLKENNGIDPFVLYLKTLELFEEKKYTEIKTYLKELMNVNNFDEDRKTILPFSCQKDQTTKRKPYPFYWRDNLTKKEHEFVLFLETILSTPHDEKTQIKFRECLSYNQMNYQGTYHLYRLALLNNQEIEFYLEFFRFLYKNQRFLEALHVLRKALELSLSLEQKNEIYFLLLYFKKVYEKLNYSKHAISLERLIQEWEKNINEPDISEIKKILSENTRLREFLVLSLFLETDETKKGHIQSLVNEYDQIFEMKEMIFYFKEIYKYY